MSREVEAELAELRRRLGNWETELTLAGLRSKAAKDEAERAQARRDVARTSMECLRLRREIERLESQRWLPRADETAPPTRRGVQATRAQLASAHGFDWWSAWPWPGIADAAALAAMLRLHVGGSGLAGQPSRPGGVRVGLGDHGRGQRHRRPRRPLRSHRARGRPGRGHDDLARGYARSPGGRHAR